MTAASPPTVLKLELEARRTRASGAQASRETDFASVMAAMRSQGLDPSSCPLELVVGPFASPGRSGEDLERFIFRAAGSDPLIEFELELRPAQLPEARWRASRASIWRRDRED